MGIFNSDDEQWKAPSYCPSTGEKYYYISEIKEIITDRNIETTIHFAQELQKKALESKNLQKRYNFFYQAQAYTTLAKAMIKLQNIYEKELQNE